MLFRSFIFIYHLKNKAVLLITVFLSGCALKEAAQPYTKAPASPNSIWRAPEQALTRIHITKEEAAEFYKVHQSKPFYNDLCNYLSSGPIFVMILEGNNAVAANRKLMGATNPKDADPNTIRKLYGISIDKNSVHGSDSVENAKIEIDFFFKN